MDWDRLFEGLEAQLAAADEAEQSMRAQEEERLRQSRLALQERLVALVSERAGVQVETAAGVLSGDAIAAGQDWIAVAAPGALSLVPFVSVRAIRVSDQDARRAVLSVPETTQHPRMGFGYVCRDLARRGVSVQLAVGAEDAIRSGTIDRAGSDHLDLAVHDPDAVRSAASVGSVQIIPFCMISWLRISERTRLPFG